MVYLMDTSAVHFDMSLTYFSYLKNHLYYKMLSKVIHAGYEDDDIVEQIHNPRTGLYKFNL